MTSQVVQETVEQKEGTKWTLVITGAVCLLAAVIFAVLGQTEGSTVTKVGNTTTTKSWPSETLITTLLAVGAVLIIVGFLWERITSIKVAGAELGLSAEQKKATVTAVAKQMPDGSPQAVAEATVSAVAAVRKAELSAGAPLEDEDIEKVVAEHAPAV